MQSLLEGGTAIRPVSHRHLLPLLAYHYNEAEQPMLLYPKCAMGTLKSLLLQARETRSVVRPFYLSLSLSLSPSLPSSLPPSLLLSHLSLSHSLIPSFPHSLTLSLFQMLTTQNLVFMASQISRGMYHLMRRGLMHRDLAARNI